jgi:hypothetical protein
MNVNFFPGLVFHSSSFPARFCTSIVPLHFFDPFILFGVETSLAGQNLNEQRFCDGRIN